MHLSQAVECFLFLLLHRTYGAFKHGRPPRVTRSKVKHPLLSKQHMTCVILLWTITLIGLLIPAIKARTRQFLLTGNKHAFHTY